MYSTHLIAEVYIPSLTNWESIKPTILALEKEAFGEKAFSDEELETDFLDIKNIVVLLKDVDLQEVFGFVYAKPDEPETNDGPANPGETAWVWNTVIKKEYRGRGLIGIMMKKLEDELVVKGFKYLETNTLVANRFAENVAKHYKDRIIKSFPLDSKWGPQVFFRIKL